MTTNDRPAPGLLRIPLNIDAIAARALAAPGGNWIAFTDSLLVPYSTDDDDEQYGEWDHGRHLAEQPNEWHSGSGCLPSETWTFLASARDDVLTLIAEVRRLRAAASHSPRARARRTRPRTQEAASVPAQAAS